MTTPFPVGPDENTREELLIATEKEVFYEPEHAQQYLMDCRTRRALRQLARDSARRRRWINEVRRLKP